MTGNWRDTLQTGLGSAYRIRQELGGGGMSSTYIAEETALSRSVVIKVLAPHLVSGLNAERFQREVLLAARLQHAFIVPLLAAGVIDDSPWYTMPLVQGESLRARVAREGALTHGATARILRDVAEALAYAHGQGIVHRDIKPDNILLSGSHALVTDFGVAKALSQSTSAGAVTGTGIAIGTPAYMAPEQAAGDTASDHRVDLYALGATAYEMLTGRAMFGHRSPAQLLMAHAIEDPEPLADAAPGTPRELTDLVTQLLQKHPNDRPANAQDVAEALGAMLTRWTSGELPPSTAHVTLARALAFWGVTFVATTTAAWIGVRWLPIPEWTLPLAIVVVLAGLPAVLLSVWLHRPARPMITVPSVASSSTVGRMEAVARPMFTWRRTRRLGMISVGLVTLLAATWAGSRALGVGPGATLVAQGQMTVTDRVFVSDIDAPPTDSGLGTVVTDLLRAELGRSASIPFVTASERTSTLRQMGWPVDSRINSSRAKEFSVRANAKIYLSGSVAPLGSGYLLRAGLFESATGNELASFRASATSTDDIIEAIDKLGRRVRDKLGASLREVRGAPALFYSVTPSLEAARLFSEGTRISNAGDQSTALRLLERAVEVDTQFAMAYRTMSSFYNNMGNAERSSWASERAFRYRDKLPPEVAKAVEGVFYASAAGYDPEKALAAYEAGIEMFGSMGPMRNNLAVMAYRIRDFERALAVYRQVLKYDTVSAFAPLNITGPMWNTGRAQETRDYVNVTLPRWRMNAALIQLERAELAGAEIRPDSVIVILESMSDIDSMPRNRRAQREGFLLNARRARGQLAAAREGMTRVLRFDAIQDTARGVSNAVLFRADIEAWERQNPAEARRILDSVTTARPPGRAGPLGYRWHQIARLYALAGAPEKAREFVDAYDRTATPNMKRYDADMIWSARGWIAMAEKRYVDAIQAFRASDVDPCRVCALPALALAYDAASEPDSAIAVFERYLTTPHYYRIGSDSRYLAFTYRRLGELYDQKGDVAHAREYYEQFAALWANADPELQPMVAQVRRRLQALRRGD